MTMTSHDARILSCLMSGTKFNGEFAARVQPMARPLRRLAEKLNETELDARQDVFDEFLEARDDREAILEAVENADPTQLNDPPDDPADDWPPFLLPSLPPADEFPIDTLHEPAAQLVREAAESVGCAQDFVGLAVLVVAAGAIGRSVSLRLKGDYFALASLFGAIIGPPGDGKSHALKAAARPLQAIDETLREEYARELKSRRVENDDASSRPKPRRIDVDDFTMESLPSIMSDNPRGLVAIKDELSALLLGMNQYKSGRGNDRPHLLKIWSGQPIKRDRVTNENRVPVACSHPCLSIIGCLTSDLVGELADERDRADGFIDRFLFVYPAARPVADWTDRSVSDDVAAEWERVVRRLFDRPLQPDAETKRPKPHVAVLTSDGQSAWCECHADHVAEMNGDGFPPNLRGPWSKLREYAGRLCLILALLDHASKPNVDHIAIPEVDRDVVDRAWRLIDYFKSHARRVYAATAYGPRLGGGPVVEVVLRWLRGQGNPSFTLRDFGQARRSINQADLNVAIKYLVGRNAIRPVDSDQARRRPGRPSAAFEVHPDIYSS